MQDDVILVVGDVGGTHTRLALAAQGQLQSESMVRLKNAEFANFAQLMQAYLSAQAMQPDAAVLAVAGPVQNGQARMTNLDWHFHASDLARTLGLRSVTLLNDLQAQGYAVPSLTSEVLTWVRAGSAARQGTALVVGLGTGVNIAPLYWRNGRPWVPPAEAGHAHLPLRTEQDFAFAQWLHKEREFASIENALSGQGLENLYQFHAQGQALSAAEVVAAMTAGDAAALQAAEQYVRLLAQTLGGWALQYLPSGGIYLVGGVARAVAPWFDPFELAKHFTDLGRVSSWLDAYSVAVVQDDHAALHGAINLGYTPNHDHTASESANDGP